MKIFLSAKMGFFAIALVLFWIKTFIIYSTEFDLGVSNVMQEFLLFFNPLSSGLIFLGLALFAKGRRAGIWGTANISRKTYVKKRKPILSVRCLCS